MKLNLNKALFWDTDFETVDEEKHARDIISRVAMWGDVNDWIEIKNFYGEEKIKNALTQIRYLDKYTLNFFSNYFNIPKDAFRCYKLQQSIPQLWPF